MILSRIWQIFSPCQIYFLPLFERQFVAAVEDGKIQAGAQRISFQNCLDSGLCKLPPTVGLAGSSRPSARCRLQDNNGPHHMEGVACTVGSTLVHLECALDVNFRGRGSEHDLRPTSGALCLPLLDRSRASRSSTVCSPWPNAKGTCLSSCRLSQRATPTRHNLLSEFEAMTSGFEDVTLFPKFCITVKYF